MKIREVEFVGSVVEPGTSPPEDLPQVAFSGRSNVGKSSLINTLLRRTRKKIARVSSTPGKTRELNFYRVNDRFLLVDLPGYGFARVPDEMREAWRKLVEGYLATEERLRGVVHLVDARHDPMDTDKQMVAFLAALQLPTLVILTKIDKLSRSERTGKENEAARALGLDAEQILPFSAKTGEGRETLLGALDHLLEVEDG